MIYTLGWQLSANQRIGSSLLEVYHAVSAHYITGTMLAQYPTCQSDSNFFNH